jgi:riboflavin synthase
MFTGIVRGIGRIAHVEGGGEARRLTIATGEVATGAWKIGDSVAVAGVCLTVAKLAGGNFEADLSGETIARTTLGRLRAGDRVNLEPALSAADFLGGHLVSGHVDGIAEVRRVEETAGSIHATIEAPSKLAHYVASKGSVTLDGVSLTVGEVSGEIFGIDIVPHTRAVTTFGSLAAGQSLNLEVDLIARYLERLLEVRAIR